MVLEEFWTKIDDIKIRYLQSGKKENPCLIFIHGLGSASDRWMKIPDSLSSNFQCFCIDLPGFGESDKPINLKYTIEDFSDIVIKFQTKLVSKPSSLIGHSLGGYITAEIAIQKPDLLKKMVLIDSSGMLQSPTPILEEYVEAAMNPSKDKVRTVFEKMVADPSRIPPALVEGFIQRINKPNAKIAFQKTLINSATTQIGIERLKRISKTSTMIIWGSQDMVIPIGHSKFFKDSIKNSSLQIIEDAGHAPFAEKQQEVGTILKEFLSD